jgi:hypothetical protein
MYQYEFPAVGTVAGEDVSILVNADALPPNVTEVRVTESTARKKTSLTFHVHVETDSVLFLGEDHKRIAVMFTVNGNGKGPIRGWNRTDDEIVVHRNGPPTSKYMLVMPWYTDVPVDYVEIHFHPSELSDHEQIDQDGY